MVSDGSPSRQRDWTASAHAPASHVRARLLAATRMARSGHGTAALASGLEQPGLGGVGDRRRPRGQIEPGEDVADVPVDGVLAQPELARDLFVGEAAGDEPDDLPLARGEGGGTGRRLAVGNAERPQLLL